MVVIKEVNTKKERKNFLEFPNMLYKDNNYFVPPLYIDEKKIFSLNYVYAKTCKSVFYNAYIDGKIVGRIEGILQYSSNTKWNQKRVRFTRFDCIDNQEVANALFDKIFEFAKNENMDEVVGPLGYSDLEREGLLIEGFDQIQTYEEQYNYPYYQKLIENYGFNKEVDWLEHQLKIDPSKKDRLINISFKLLERYHLKLVVDMPINKFIKRYANQFFDILDKTYENIYGTVPFTKEMKQNMISGFRLIVNTKYLAAIVDENDNIVAFSIAFPNIGKDLISTGGHLYPLTLLKLIRTIKKPNGLDLGLIGVVDKYKNMGVSSALLGLIIKSMEDYNISYAETNLNLEDNHAIINQWSNFKYIQHKRRRCFIKNVN